MTVTFDIVALISFLGKALFVAIVVGIVVLLWQKVRRFIAGRKYDPSDRAALQNRWAEIETMVQTPGEMSAKLAVIEADKLLDHALKALAFPGNTLGERLRFAQYKYPDLRNVWWAHKVRNQLAHEASYHLERGMAKRAVAEFRRALIRLGAI
jgi:hypothetical protein